MPFTPYTPPVSTAPASGFTPYKPDVATAALDQFKTGIQPMSSVHPDLQSALATQKPSYFSRVGSDISSGLKETGAAVKSSVDANMNGTGKDPLSTGLQVAAPLVKAAASPLMEGISSLGSQYLKGLAGPLAEPIHKGLEAIGNSSGGEAAKNALAGIVGAWQSFKEAHPTLAADAKSVFDIATNLPVVAGEAALGKAGVEAASEPVANAIDKVKQVPESIKTTLSPKRLDEVLMTPESEVAKLNPVERKAWFENQQSQIVSKHEALNETIQKDLQAKTEAGLKEAEQLQRKLATTSRDKVLDLRPKIISSMGEQSKTYRSLVDEAMAGKESVPVDKGDLKSFIDSRFAEDPAKAAAVKERLGLTEQVDPLTTKMVSPELRKPTTTLGKIYDQTKALKQTIAKGTKVFSADDKLTDDSVHTLLSYMKGQGVDLKEANQFWAKYAPVRDQLVNEARPFLQSGTQTKKLASTLVKVAQGNDVNNENFISETEKLLGEPVTKEVKGVLRKLDANKKSALADQIAAETKKAESDMLKEAKLKTLSDTQFEIERQARVRGIIKKVLLTAGGLGVDKIVKKYTGIGF